MKRAVLGLIALITLAGCATAPQREDTIVFYPPLPQRPRLQFLHAFTGEEDIGGSQGALMEFLVGQPTSDKRIGKSYDIGSSDGKIYILDRRYRKLLILDLASKKFDYLRDQRLGALNDPAGIWVTEDDIKYIADMGRHQIVVFGRDNTFLKTYGNPDVLDKPVDVAVFETRIYVCDMKKHRIIVLDKDSGNVEQIIGKEGAEEGFLARPTHVVVDHKGNIFVTDAFNFRVQKFDPNGNFVKSYGYVGDTLGAFARPKGLDIDREGNLYVADAAFENVQIFNAETGDLLLFFGGPGEAPGNMYLPSGVHIDYRNGGYFSNFVDKDFRLKYILYVGNTFGANKLNVYGFGEWIGQ